MIRAAAASRTCTRPRPNRPANSRCVMSRAQTLEQVSDLQGLCGLILRVLEHLNTFTPAWAAQQPDFPRMTKGPGGLVIPPSLESWATCCRMGAAQEYRDQLYLQALRLHNPSLPPLPRHVSDPERYMFDVLRPWVMEGIALQQRQPSEESREGLIKTYGHLRDLAEAADCLASAINSALRRVGSRQKPLSFELPDDVADEAELAHGSLRRLIDAATDELPDKACKAVEALREWYKGRQVLPDDMRFNQPRAGKSTIDDDLCWVSTAAGMLDDTRAAFKRAHKLTRDEVRRSSASGIDQAKTGDEATVDSPGPLREEDRDVFLVDAALNELRARGKKCKFSKEQARIVVAMARRQTPVPADKDMIHRIKKRLVTAGLRDFADAIERSAPGMYFVRRDSIGSDLKLKNDDDTVTTG